MLDFFIHPRNTEHLLFASFKRRTSEQDNHEQNTSPSLMKVTVLYDEIENRQFCRSRAMKVSPTQLNVSYFMQKVRECLLVPYCCCNKLPQTQWCKPTHIYYLTVLEVRSLKWIGRAAFLLDALRRIHSCLLQLLGATSIPWLLVCSSLFKASSSALQLSLPSHSLLFLTRTS